MYGHFWHACWRTFFGGKYSGHFFWTFWHIGHTCGGTSGSVIILIIVVLTVKDSNGNDSFWGWLSIINSCSRLLHFHGLHYGKKVLLLLHYDLKYGKNYNFSPKKNFILKIRIAKKMYFFWWFFHCKKMSKNMFLSKKKGFFGNFNSLCDVAVKKNSYISRTDVLCTMYINICRYYVIF